jgi:large subunit ribosomal protein L9
MELILKQDVANLGFKDDIVSVKNGYGRNFLIPQGVAVLATSSAKKVLAETLKQRAYKEQSIVKEATKLAEAIKGLEVKITAKTGEGDKLFGSIGNSDIVDALATEGHELEKKFISIAGGLVKRLGKYNATVRLHRDVIVELPFEVIAEKK